MQTGAKIFRPFFLNSSVTILRHSKMTRDKYNDVSTVIFRRKTSIWSRGAMSSENFRKNCLPSSELLIFRRKLLFLFMLLSHIHSNKQTQTHASLRIEQLSKGSDTQQHSSASSRKITTERVTPYNVSNHPRSINQLSMSFFLSRNIPNAQTACMWVGGKNWWRPKFSGRC